MVLVFPRVASFLHRFGAWSLLRFCLARGLVRTFTWTLGDFLLQGLWLVIDLGSGLDEDAVDERAQGRDALVVIETKSGEVDLLLFYTIFRKNTSFIGLE